MVTHWPAFLVKENLKTCYLKRDGKSTNMGMSLRAQKRSDYSNRFMWVK